MHTVSIGIHSMVAVIPAAAPAINLSKLVVSSFPEILSSCFLYVSYAQKLTALNGAVRRILTKFPLQKPFKPCVVAIFLMSSSRLLCSPRTMYSNFNLSSGATKVLEQEKIVLKFLSFFFFFCDNEKNNFSSSIPIRNIRRCLSQKMVINHDCQKKKSLIANLSKLKTFQNQKLHRFLSIFLRQMQ